MPVARSRDSTWFSMAVLALARLAHSSAPCSSSEMAPDLQAHAVFLRRVLAQLGRAGLIESREGRAGGYLLARSPEEITLADVYQATQALDAPESAQDSWTLSISAQSSAVQSALDQVEAEAERERLKVLGRVTLASLLRCAQAADQPH